MFQWQKFHIFDEMFAHDCFFTIINPEEYHSIDEANVVIINSLKTGKYDLFMTCLGDSFFNNSFFVELKKLSIKSLLFCPDNLVAPFNHKMICKEFDLVWLTSKETEYLFKKWGAKTIFLPYAANPNLCTPVPSDYLKKRIVFVGTPHGSRVRIINYLLKHGIPVTVYTSKVNTDNKFWKTSFSNYFLSFAKLFRFKIGIKLAFASLFDKLSRPKIDFKSPFLEMCDAVPPDQISTVYSNYVLVLSFTEANSTGVFRKPVDIMNLRNFEIPMSGSIQICRYTNEISSYFPNGIASVLYRNKKDFLKKARCYLSNDAEESIKSMKANARKLAEENHSWNNRFSIIFDYLFNK